MTGFFFFKQKTAYEMRISDWSSDVCSSDLGPGEIERDAAAFAPARDPREHIAGAEADIEDAPRAVADTTRPDPVEKATRRSRRQPQRVDPRPVSQHARIAVGRQPGGLPFLFAVHQRATAGPRGPAPHPHPPARTPGPQPPPAPP